MKLTRAIAPTALVAALLLTTACSTGSSSGGGSNTDCAPSGSVSDSIKVEGNISEDIALTSKTPVQAESLERTVMTEGSGDVIGDGQGLVVSTAFFNGATGELIQPGVAQGVVYDAATMEQSQPWVAEVLPCAQTGQRTAVVGTATDTFGQPGEALGLADFTDDDNLVIVTDVLGVVDLTDGAEGKANKLPDNFPEVSTADDGSPEIVIPEGVDAPTKLSVETIVDGDGEEVKPGDIVFVNYRGVIWRTGEEFDSSWTNGSPIAFSTTGVIAGFTEALEGHTVGSQVISIVPADDGGYGAESLTGMGHEADDVMVFVLDILGTVHVDD